MCTRSLAMRVMPASSRTCTRLLASQADKEKLSFIAEEHRERSQPVFLFYKVRGLPLVCCCCCHALASPSSPACLERRGQRMCAVAPLLMVCAHLCAHTGWQAD